MTHPIIKKQFPVGARVRIHPDYFLNWQRRARNRAGTVVGYCVFPADCIRVLWDGRKTVPSGL